MEPKHSHPGPPSRGRVDPRGSAPSHRRGSRGSARPGIGLPPVHSPTTQTPPSRGGGGKGAAVLDRQRPQAHLCIRGYKHRQETLPAAPTQHLSRQEEWGLLSAVPIRTITLSSPPALAYSKLSPTPFLWSLTPLPGSPDQRGQGLLQDLRANGSGPWTPAWARARCHLLQEASPACPHEGASGSPQAMSAEPCPLALFSPLCFSTSLPLTVNAIQAGTVSVSFASVPGVYTSTGLSTQ